MKSCKLTCERKWNWNKVIFNNYIVRIILLGFYRVNPIFLGSALPSRDRTGARRTSTAIHMSHNSVSALWQDVCLQTREDA